MNSKLTEWRKNLQIYHTLFWNYFEHKRQILVSNTNHIHNLGASLRMMDKYLYIRRPGNSQLKKTFYFSFKAFLNIKTNKTFQESQPILVHFYHLDLKKRGEILPCQFLDLTFRQFHVEAEKNKISLLWVSGTQTYEWPESHFIIPHALK